MIDVLAGSTYCMCPILCPLEVHHAIQTSVGRAIALIAMGIQLLFGEDVAAALEIELASSSVAIPRRWHFLVHTMRQGSTYLARERNHTGNFPSVGVYIYIYVCGEWLLRIANPGSIL